MILVVTQIMAIFSLIKRDEVALCWEAQGYSPHLKALGILYKGSGCWKVEMVLCN